MPIGDFLRRRPEGQTCQACGSPLPHGAVFCPSCGVKTDDPQAEPLHIVDRTTGLFNDRFVRPVLEDELARAHRYQRNLGVLLIEANGAGTPDETLKIMAAALAGTVRDVDTPGVSTSLTVPASAAAMSFSASSGEPAPLASISRTPRLR